MHAKIKVVFRFEINQKCMFEPYLGFLHSEQFGKPCLVCDLMEMYRYLIDDFLIQYFKSLKKKDFSMKSEDFSRKRKGQREYLKKALAKDLLNKLNSFFESKVEIPRIKHGKRHEIEMLLNQEALLLAKCLRSERNEWTLRIPSS
jgi:CRISPR-associated protein Cas1